MKTAIQLSWLGAMIALSTSLPAAPEIEVFAAATPTGPALTAGQTEVIDFGCTKPGTPVQRPFTVLNSGDEPLVIPAESLTLPPGYSLSGGWPMALVAPEVLVEVDKDDSGTAIEPRMYGAFIKNMPAAISVTALRLTIPTDPQGRNPPDSQLPYFDRDTGGAVSIDPAVVADDLNRFNPGPAPKDVRGLVADPGNGGKWDCNNQGINPNGDICFSFEDQIFDTGPKQNRHRSMVAHFPIGAFSGTLDDAPNNDFFRFGAEVAGLDPPALAPPAGDNGDGDNYGIAGVRVAITFHNASTQLDETIETVFVDDGIDDDRSEVCISGSPVLVPVPIILQPGQTFTFQVQLDALSEGVFAGPWELENNDIDENPFNFPITGLVDGTPPQLVGLPANLSVPAIPGLCFAVASWTPPGAIDALDPAPPTVSLTGGLPPNSVFPVGTTTVEYSATDCAGNTAVGSFNVLVRDETPPVLSAVTKLLVVNAAPGATSALVTFAAPTATDDCDPAPIVTCSPESGSEFPLGLTRVTCTATDSSGNSTSVSFDVIVIPSIPSPAPLSLDLVAQRDSIAPGLGTPFFNFDHFFINRDGDVLFEATASGITGLWAGTPGGGVSLVAAAGTAAGATGANYLRFRDHALNDSGVVSYLAQLSGAGISTANDFAIFMDAGSAAALLQEGDPAPGVSGDIKIIQPPALSGLGDLYFAAHLLVGSGTVTIFDDTTLWGNPGGTLELELIAREGDLVPASAGLASGAAFGQLTSRVVTNASGQIAYSALLDIGPGGISGADNSIVLAGLPGSEAAVTTEGSLAPGGDPAAFGAFQAESINNHGAVALRAQLKSGFGGTPVTSANDDGIWTNSPGSLTLLGREGDPAPCLPDAGTVFDRFGEIIIVDSGDVYFRAYLRGPLVNSSNDGSLWRFKLADGQVHLVAREGDIAPGTGNALIGLIGQFAANHVGGVVHESRLVSGIGDAVVRNNQGLFVDSGSDGLPIIRVRKDDRYSDPGGTEISVTELRLDRVANTAGGTGGYGSVMNDAGQVGFLSAFDLQRSGIFILPASAP